MFCLSLHYYCLWFFSTSHRRKTLHTCSCENIIFLILKYVNVPKNGCYIKIWDGSVHWVIWKKKRPNVVLNVSHNRTLTLSYVWKLIVYNFLSVYIWHMNLFEVDLSTCPKPKNDFLFILLYLHILHLMFRAYHQIYQCLIMDSYSQLNILTVNF